MRFLGRFRKDSQERKPPIDTRPLKRGEIKNILQRKAGEAFPDFEFIGYKNTSYTFRRIREFSNYKVHELLHIGFSLKGGVFSCSLASRMNPTLIYNNWYNAGLINPHFELIQLKKGTGMSTDEESYYFHNGMLETCSEVVDEILLDIKKFGLPFLEKQYVRLTQNGTILTGLKYIEGLDSRNVGELKLVVEEDLRVGRGHISLLKSPIYIDLKRRLQSVPGETREFRKKLPNAALELIQLHWAISLEQDGQ